MEFLIGGSSVSVSKELQVVLSILSSLPVCENAKVLTVAAKMFSVIAFVDFLWSTSSRGSSKLLKVSDRLRPSSVLRQEPDGT